MMNKWIRKMQEHPERMFLIDGIGALVTVFSLLSIAQLESHFGMPPRVLYVLVVMVSFYAIYSFSCRLFLFKKEQLAAKWRNFLLIIATANGLYCVVMSFLMITFYKQLTLLGLFYFINEVLLILLLVRFELKVASKK